MGALGHATQESAINFVTGEDLAPYRPFHLTVFGLDGHPQSCRWDGTQLICDRLETPGLVATSSSRDQEGAERIRRALFQNAAQAPSGLSEQVLDDLHRSREPEPGPYAISMERSDAGTISMSHVRVSQGDVSFDYTPGPPHHTDVRERVSLRRAGHVRPVAHGATDHGAAGTPHP